MFVVAIIGGENVINPHQYPWMVQIVSYDMDTSENLKKNSPCGGAIISKNMILTAAHCVERGWREFSRGSEYSKKTATFVRIGHPKVDYSITVKVKSKLINPNYFTYFYRGSNFDSVNVNKDIALLELSVDLKFNRKIQPIALPDEDFDEANYLDKSRSKFMVAGWGMGFDIPNDFYNSEMWPVHKYKIPKEKYLRHCGDRDFLKCDDGIKLMSTID